MVFRIRETGTLLDRDAPVRTMALWRSLTIGARLVLASIFLIAGGSKVAQPWAFVHTVEQYQMLPSTLARPFALGLPWIELLVGLYLLVGLFTRAASTAATALLILFLVALATQIARGHTNMSCGCVDWNTPLVTALAGGDTIGTWDLVRDALLAMLAGMIALTPQPPLTIDVLLARRRDDLTDDDGETAPASA